ncbi:MAG: CAP domain-containing protein [Patescibacteria group bacterium]
MKRTCKKYFIPHAANNYHPHFLHTKRALFYSALFVSMKLIVFIAVLALPATVFVLPDVLAEEQKKIIVLTNAIRANSHLKDLTVNTALNNSSQAKADDMAVNAYFSHTSPSGKTVSDFVRSSGYKYSTVGENLAMGFASAEDAVNAWVNSPTHYANMIDKDYVDLGVGLESGVYAGEQTVYVAQHFGSPSAMSEQTITEPVKKVAVAKDIIVPVEKTIATTSVLAEKETAAIIQPAIFDHANSKVYWQEADGGTKISVRAKITGSVDSAQVNVNDNLIDLQSSGDSMYQGEFFVNEPAENFFKVIVLPEIKIASAGTAFQDSVDWFNIQTTGQTPVQKYIKAQSALSGWTKIFSVTRDIYCIFIGIFSAALLLSIFVEFKRQHPHIIIQTLGLIGLLACLAIV